MSTTTTPQQAAINPGADMATAVDVKMQEFRSYQQEMAEKQTTLQKLVGQQAENEMVQQELRLLSDQSVVYKKVGPVLLKNDLEDARMTVEKRLEFIAGERAKLETNMKELEVTANATAKKINEMQGLMQKAAVEAVKATVAQETGNK